MEENRGSVRGKEGGKRERGKRGNKGGGVSPWLLRGLVEAVRAKKQPPPKWRGLTLGAGWL